MPNDIDLKAWRVKQKRAATGGVLVFALIQLACIGCFAALLFIPELPGWLFGLFAVLMVICVFPLIGAFVMLRRRIREIEGGEYDEASQY